MLPRSEPSGQLADMDTDAMAVAGGNGRPADADEQWQASAAPLSLSVSPSPQHEAAARLPTSSDGPLPAGAAPASSSPSAGLTVGSSSASRRTGSAQRPKLPVLPLSTGSSSRLDVRSSSSNPSTTSSASSSNTISLPMSSTSMGGNSSPPSASLHTTRSRDSAYSAGGALPSPRAHSESRHMSFPPPSASAGSNTTGTGHGGLLHPLRMSTRPSTKRASSYTPGLVVSPQGYGAHHTNPSSPLHSPLLPPGARPEHRSSSIDMTPAIAQASSISLPMAGEEILHHKLEELVRKTSISKQAPSSLLQGHRQDHLNPPSTSTSSASASSSQIPAHYQASSSSSHRDGYEAERELDSETPISDPSQPSSLEPHLDSNIHTLTSRHLQQQHYQQQQHHRQQAAGPPSRHNSTSRRPLPPASPAQAGKGKGREREFSGSSNDNPQARDFALDDQTDLEVDTNTDLASDAGNTTWDVRETDKLRSAKDAFGRRMINQ